MPACRIRMGARPGAVFGYAYAEAASATAAAQGVAASIKPGAGLVSAVAASYGVAGKPAVAAGHASATGIARNVAGASGSATIGYIYEEMVSTSQMRITWTVLTGTTPTVAQGWIEYGTTTSFGTETAHETSFDYPTHTQNITGLTPGATYYYRIRGVLSGGAGVVGPTYSFSMVTPEYGVRAATPTSLADIVYPADVEWQPRASLDYTMTIGANEGAQDAFIASALAATSATRSETTPLRIIFPSGNTWSRAACIKITSTWNHVVFWGYGATLNMTRTSGNGYDSGFMVSDYGPTAAAAGGPHHVKILGFDIPGQNAGGGTAECHQYPDVTTTLAAALTAGQSNIKVASVSGLVVGRLIKVNSHPGGARRISAVGTAGSGGTGVTISGTFPNSASSGATTEQVADEYSCGILIESYSKHLEVADNLCRNHFGEGIMKDGGWNLDGTEYTDTFDDCSIHHNTVDKTGRMGVTLNFGRRFRFHHNWIKNAGWASIAAEDSRSTTNPIDDYRIDDNLMQDDWWSTENAASYGPMTCYWAYSLHNSGRVGPFQDFHFERNRYLGRRSGGPGGSGGTGTYTQSAYLWLGDYAETGTSEGLQKTRVYIRDNDFGSVPAGAKFTKALMVTKIDTLTHTGNNWGGVPATDIRYSTSVTSSGNT